MTRQESRKVTYHACTRYTHKGASHTTLDAMHAVAGLAERSKVQQGEQRTASLGNESRSVTGGNSLPASIQLIEAGELQSLRIVSLHVEMQSVQSKSHTPAEPSLWRCRTELGQRQARATPGARPAGSQPTSWAQRPGRCRKAAF